MEDDKTVVIASVIYFSIVDKHAKIICIGTASGGTHARDVCCRGSILLALFVKMS